MNISFSLDFKRNPYPGTYIAIEGIDGSGKSTQVQAVKEYFQGKGRTVVITGEPNDSLVIGKFIREQILDGKVTLPSKAFQAIYSADRVVNHETIVIPALQRGDVVISHRTFWSVIPYGVKDIGHDTYDKKTAEILMVSQGILSQYYQFIVSDIAFYLDIPVDIALARLSEMDKKKDIYENREKLATIAQGYRWLAQQFPKEITQINGEQPVGKVSEEIIKHVSRIT